MATRQKRNVRFDQLKQLHAAYKAGINDAQKTKDNVVFSGYKIYEKELPKFAEAYPLVDLADFTSWLKEFDAFKGSHKGDGSRGASASLNTREKALEVGVKESDIPQYITLVEAMKGLAKDLQKLTPNGSVSLAIPKRKAKETVSA